MSHVPSLSEANAMREEAQAALVREQLCQGSLLDGQERADLVAAWADDADDGCRGQQERVAGEQKGYSGHHHQHRS